ncbi:ATP-dependent 3'-5' DNA helicase, partial [Spiromyces aspiralis]
MFRGDIKVIVSTTALELGIDIGSLDAVVMLGVPANPTTMWQQAGRAGRRSQDSLVMVVADGSKIDQYYVAQPDRLWTRPYPRAVLSSESDILASHLHCAAFEIPIDPELDRGYFACEDLDGVLAMNLLKDVDGRWTTKLSYKPWPPERVAIRSILASDWAIFDATNGDIRLLEELDAIHAIYRVYEDQSRKVALVEQTRVDWLTKKRDIVPREAKKSAKFFNGLVAQYGPVDVRVTVFGYHRVDGRTGAIIETVETKPKTLVAASMGLWVDIPNGVTRSLAMDSEQLGDAIHACQHALVNVIVQTNGGATQESLSVDCKSPYESRVKQPRLILFERDPRFEGPTHLALRNIGDIMRHAYAVIRECEHEEGCTQ